MIHPATAFRRPGAWLIADPGILVNIVGAVRRGQRQKLRKPKAPPGLYDPVCTDENLSPASTAGPRQS